MAMSSGLTKKGHFMVLQCERPHSSTSERYRPFFRPLHLPPSIQAQSPWHQWCWVLQDPGRPVLQVVLQACHVGSQGPNLKVCPYMRRALIFLHGSSGVKLLLLGQRHWQRTWGNGLVSKIWEWPDMEASGCVY